MNVGNIALIAGGTTAALLAVAGTYYAFLNVSEFAEDQKNIYLVTTVREAQAKAIMVNDSFERFIMSYSGYKFRGADTVKKRMERRRPDGSVVKVQDKNADGSLKTKTGVNKDGTPMLDADGKPIMVPVMVAEMDDFHDDHAQWDIVPDPNYVMTPTKRGLTSGLYWVGLPPKKVYQYNATWIAWDFPRGNDGKPLPNSKKQAVRHNEEKMTHVLLADDVYFLEVDDAETKAEMPDVKDPSIPVPAYQPGIPVDVKALLTIAITNPFKALFLTQKWYETVTNQMEANLREYVGDHTFEFLTKHADTDSLLEELQYEISRIERLYGVLIKKIQFQSIQPGSELSKEIRETQLKPWAATQEAMAQNITTDAKARDIEKIGTAALVNPTYSVMNLVKDSNLVNLGGDSPIILEINQRLSQDIKDARDKANSPATGIATTSAPPKKPPSTP